MSVAGMISITVVVLCLIALVLEYNKFIKLKNKIKQSRSAIDVYLTQRFDLIPNLVECVKSYAKYEQETLKEITKLRTNYEKTKDLKTAQKVSNDMIKLMAVGESNANLKASEQYLNLQKGLEKMESQLQAARRVYNGDITLYNTTISQFPDNLIASMFGFKEEELFEIEEYKKADVKVEF